MKRPDIYIEETTTAHTTSQELVRRPKNKGRPVLELVLPALSIASAGMVAIAAPSIVGSGDIWSYLKIGVLATSTALVSFGVNKLAIDRGVPLAATGYFGAMVASLLSIGAVGSSLATFSFSGLVMGDVTELRLQEHGAQLVGYVNDQNASASQATRVNPVIRSIADDLKAKAECEIKVSCISGRGNGGYGTVARTVESYASRASSLLTQIDAGEAARTKIAASMNTSIADYQRVLSDQGRGLDDRRTALSATDAEIRQFASELGEAIPLPLLSAYATELMGGALLPEHTEAQGRLNGILASHGQSLATVVKGISKQENQPPSLPRKTGVADTLNYIMHFLPIAAIVAVIELIFPLVLWLYAFWMLHWEKFKISPPDRDDHDTNISAPSFGSRDITFPRRVGRPPQNRGT